ncbi:MAG: ATP-dependent protease ATPase subunit HslU [Candidatus Cloacimonetes bacterium]|jgi:ATP-dependent HslUV protease ATP-binding subunit HslU|nr:ATP-dependent protease ATPase subunit HslU [Candidatus Cloacimonadota bacterium]MDY0172074.1 ATP-dependent protease ATPase subunit HslU [Candidatus Cloacimonadaceae bacterium]
MIEIDSLTPVRIVEELNKYIISQNAAKRSVAIALRNRWRRQQVQSDMRREIMPNNIIMIGPTGVGKTEIARRIARLVNAPFIKVEASKFTEVGYVGRDVESMIRELMSYAVTQTRTQMVEEVEAEARALAIEKVLDALLPLKRRKNDAEDPEALERHKRSRDKMRKKLINNQMDDKFIDIEIPEDSMPNFEIMTNFNMEAFDLDFSDMLSNLMPGRAGKKKHKTTVAKALKTFTEHEIDQLVPRDKVADTAKRAVEENGIVFIDEIDKIATTDKHGGIDVSRSGVQRDLLPIVEGSSVPTKYGPIDTAHILFIAAGAFTSAKPSDLIPELQGRFPIRVELSSLTEQDFVRILSEPENALTKQYKELFHTEGVELSFSAGAIKEIARFAALANEKMEDIGARRLHTILNTLLDDFLFEMPSPKLKKVSITKNMVIASLSPVIESEDLSRFIL